MKLTLFSLFAFLLLACQPQQQDKGLKDVSSFPIGTAIRINQLLNNSEMQDIVLKDFSSLTLENNMKMYSVVRPDNKYNWKNVDAIVDFSTQYNKRLHGHAFIWHAGTPDWVRDNGQDSVWLANFMEDYILTYGSRYKGKVAGWDVVNEAISDSAGTFRSSLWYNTFGEEFIARAFELAHEADPDAVLFYNDYNIERDTVKLHAALRMIKKLKDQNIPISGIGLQMHIRMDTDEKIIEYALKKAAETGLQVHISELDIIFNTHNDSPGGGIQLYEELTDSMANAQAEKYKWLARAYIKNVPAEQRYGITVWGFDDQHSWIPSFFDINDWPCLYDDDLKPKPAYSGFMEGLSAE